MTNAPEIPDEFDSEKDLKAYIDRLHDQIEFLEEEVEESEKEKLELKQELNEIEDKASAGGGLQDIHAALEEFIETVEDIDTHGEPSDVGLHDSLRNPDFKS